MSPKHVINETNSTEANCLLLRASLQILWHVFDIRSSEIATSKPNPRGLTLKL